MCVRACLCVGGRGREGGRACVSLLLRGTSLPLPFVKPGVCVCACVCVCVCVCVIERESVCACMCMRGRRGGGVCV